MRSRQHKSKLSYKSLESLVTKLTFADQLTYPRPVPMTDDSINLDKKEFYQFDKPESVKTTLERLKQLKDMGVKEIGFGEFGIYRVVSGLYIEKVWSYTPKQWDEYITWMKGVIDAKA